MRGDKIEAIANFVLRNTKTKFLGVFASDKLPDINSFTFPCSFIANTDPAHLPGTHWVAFYLPSANKSEFYDSYGFPSSSYGFTFPTTSFNHVQFQSIHSHTCGEHCIFFLYMRTHCPCPSSAYLTAKHPYLNDKKVHRWVKHILTNNLVPSPKCTNNQSCKCRSH